MFPGVILANVPPLPAAAGVHLALCTHQTSPEEACGRGTEEQRDSWQAEGPV